MLRLAVICAGILVISQVLLLKEGTRFYLSQVDRLEGEQISLQLPLYAGTPLNIMETIVTNHLKSLRESKVIMIRMIKPLQSNNVFVTVNGKVMDSFQKNSIKLTVYDGDYVEIDATLLKEQAQFIVNVPGSGLSVPIDGLVLESNSSVVVVGKIKFNT
ncbi:MAG TPA: hypothetical protein VGL27_09780 [Negativicutes bacterium]